MIVGQTRDRKYIRASDFEAAGAMTALLKDAFAPNLVQTIENNPALIHGGPFANIAHGCNSVIATKTALKLADYVRSEEHTSELQSHSDLVCRLLLEKKKKTEIENNI